MIRALVTVACLAGCASGTELSISVQRPSDQRGLAAISQLNFTATRDGIVLGQNAFPAGTTEYTLDGITHGLRTVLTLDGVDSTGTVIARGRTCPIDFEAAGTNAALYFSPTNFFAVTAAAPLTTRTGLVASALSTGAVLVTGGVADGTVLGTTEVFEPGLVRFSAYDVALQTPRTEAQSVAMASVGQLVVGGHGGDGVGIALAELYDQTQAQFRPIDGLEGRVEHGVVVIEDGRALVTGGAATIAGTPMATSSLIYVQTNGSQVSPGPPLSIARRRHAIVAAGTGALVFGGYDVTGAVLDSIEFLDPAVTSAAPPIAQLTHARGEATASLLPGGAILVVGGLDENGSPRADAELFQPYSRKTTVYPMTSGRRGHTATVLADGRVLVVGGFDGNGNALTSVELFDSSVGFLTERSLASGRGGHVAVPLCDATVLIIGGSAGAELYTEPAN